MFSSGMVLLKKKNEKLVIRFFSIHTTHTHIYIFVIFLDMVFFFYTQSDIDYDFWALFTLDSDLLFPFPPPLTHFVLCNPGILITAGNYIA